MAARRKDLKPYLYVGAGLAAVGLTALAVRHFSKKNKKCKDTPCAVAGSAASERKETKGASGIEIKQEVKRASAASSATETKSEGASAQVGSVPRVA